jgi:site-specific DNA-methyltransferase (adenine-specific)
VNGPYWQDGGGALALYLGDMREVLPALGVTADLVLADPLYGETSLKWDRWTRDWLGVAAATASSMWCFGSMRMFAEQWSQFGDAGWKLSQDVIGVDADGAPVYGDVTVVWEKHNGSGAAADRFRRVHEYVLHWYRGTWREVYHEVPRVLATPAQVARNGVAPRASRPMHYGHHSDPKTWRETGTRLMRSVMQVRSMWGRAIHPFEKPVDLLKPLIEYACPPGGLVVDPFAGSGSTLEAARLTGRRAIGIEVHEPYAEAAAKRLAQAPLELA